MATPFNELPFELSFQVGNTHHSVRRFYDNEHGFYEHIDDPSVVLVENLKITIDFKSSDDNARLYMYGLETIPYRGVEFDERGEAFLFPNEGSISLFDESYYPLIPGTYQIRVESEDKVWYAPFAIQPKQISTHQLNIMRDQLEDVIRGLAFDFIGKQFAKGQQLGKSLPPRLLMQFMIISNHFPNVMAALSDLYTKVNFRTRKEYDIVRSDRANVVDEETVRHRLKHPEMKGFLKVPVRTIDYNLPENIWIKHIVRQLILVLNDFVLSVEQHASALQGEIEQLQKFDYQASTKIVLEQKSKVLDELQQYLDMVQRMKIGFQLITSAHWYDQLQEKPLTVVPYVLTKDARYRSIYMLYRELQQDELEIMLDPMYSYQWKRTDKLYEMWGYVELLRILEKKLEFNPVRGWIYNLHFNGEGMLIPSLPAGERVILEKGELQLHFVYDGVVPLTSKETQLFVHPLYVRQQYNRPDGRLDVYRAGVYCGSIMIDFKYRPRHNFWEKDRVNTIARTREMNQLIAYSDSRSSFLYGEDRLNNKPLQRLSPVAEVWAFYPVKEGREESPSSSVDHSLRLIPLTPGNSNAHVTGEFERILQQLLQDSEAFAGNSK
ncbi:DUF2357 domain-containing protein [Paenibacillus xylaniclasticus]|uniref:DUF2357 domain-containing protein n=1 Tax=Paenibacillus xylaniclasticus TaxID=588083 RepID=UPI000FD7E4B8|nr:MULTISPECIES: DUF2357 domain-containing protein [Paenibacillus]GFN32954.1 hypothetical protein PCURB6_32140 [Paenibacillus curdlanolyticus]